MGLGGHSAFQVSFLPDSVFALLSLIVCGRDLPDSVCDTFI